MIPISIDLPVQLHHQLQFVAKEQHKSVNGVVRCILEKALARQYTGRMKLVYEALEKVKGIGKEPVTDVSATINERLYGPDGAWKGRHE